MTTIKFKEASPYTKPPAVAPEEDYLYKIFQDNVGLRSDRQGEKVLNLAIFGLGRAGTIHLSLLARSVRVKILYIVEDLESKWEALRDFWSLGETTFLSSKQARTVYDDPRVDAVIVTSPTTTHEAIVLDALKAKKAVFCEKPIARTQENIAKCYEAANAVGKPLFCAFMRRFDPSYSSVRQRVIQGEVGHVRIIKACTKDSPLPPVEYLRDCGGIFNDVMVHDIDVLIWIFGEFPTRVAVQAHAHIPEVQHYNDHDTAVATLYFPSGTLGIIDVSRHSNYGHDQRLEVFGPKGLILANNQQPISNNEIQYGLNGCRTAPIFYNFSSRYREAYQREMEHFLDVLQGKAKLAVHPKETLAVGKIAAACEKSARTGQMVELKWAPDELPDRD